MGIDGEEGSGTHVVKRVRFSQLGPTHRCDTCGWEGTLNEVADHEGKKRNDDFQQQLAAIIEKAIQDALVIQASPQGLDDIAIDGLALNAAESMTGQFDILSKDQQKYAICEWDAHYAEPSRGSYMGAWVPSPRWEAVRPIMTWTAAVTSESGDHSQFAAKSEAELDRQILEMAYSEYGNNPDDDEWYDPETDGDWDSYILQHYEIEKQEFDL